MSDYKDVFLKVNALPVCFMMIFDDIILFFKLWNGYYDVDVSQFVSFTLGKSGLRSASHVFFATRHGSKFKTDNYYYHRVTKMAN